MPIKTISPIAQLVNTPRDVSDRKKVQAFGVCIHTTGSGVPTKAKQQGIPPIEKALAYYLAPGNPFPHYVIDTDGLIIQTADEKEKAWHAGMSSEERQLYLSGEWRKKVNQKTLVMWDAKWHRKSPSHLFPSTGPNEDYIGIECIPMLEKLPNGSLYTDQQYDSLSKLLIDIEKRHGIELKDNRLVGHEDLEPLTRWNSSGGWDPGALCDKPKFLWSKLKLR